MIRIEDYFANYPSQMKVVEIMLRDHLYERSAVLGEHLRKRARELQRELPGTIREVRALGLVP